MYVQCNSYLELVAKKMKIIRSDYHNLFTYPTDKIALSAFDDKQWILGDGITTLAHGHYKRNEQTMDLG